MVKCRSDTSKLCSVTILPRPLNTTNSIISCWSCGIRLSMGAFLAGNYKNTTRSSGVRLLGAVNNWHGSDQVFKPPRSPASTTIGMNVERDGYVITNRGSVGTKGCLHHDLLGWCGLVPCAVADWRNGSTNGCTVLDRHLSLSHNLNRWANVTTPNIALKCIRHIANEKLGTTCALPARGRASNSMVIAKL